MKKFLVTAAFVASIAYSQGLQLKALAQQGGGNGGQNADNLGADGGDFHRLNEIPDMLVGAVFHYVAASVASGGLNHHWVGDKIEGGASGDDIGDDSGDRLGGNSVAGGWGGEKT